MFSAVSIFNLLLSFSGDLIDLGDEGQLLSLALSLAEHVSMSDWAAVVIDMQLLSCSSFKGVTCDSVIFDFGSSQFDVFGPI